MNKIMSLNGDWQMIWDTEDLGYSNRWYATYPEKTETVTVPHIWERAFDKVLISQDCAYYFKRFTIDDEKQVTKRIFIRFERVATYATVWLNGKHIGDHFGAYTPFILETQKAIKLGEENILCVRVANMGSSNGRIDLGRESAEGADDRYVQPAGMPVGKPWLDYPFGGIFGNVDLIQGNAAFIADMHIEPDMDQERVAVELAFNNPRGCNTRVRLIMRNPSGDTYEYFKDNIKLDKENATLRLVLGIKDWKKDKCVWSLDTPNMFAIEAQMENKSVKSKEPEFSFSIVKTFSFRKFECLNGDFYLNDSIIKIQGLGYNQQWSKGGLWTSLNNDLKKDLKAVKAAGFNAIRSCGAPLSTEALDICDEIGLLVFQELPIHTMRSSTNGYEIAKDLINDLVKESHHHPCIALWVLGSENGSFMLQNGTKLLKAISPVDMCRPAISNLDSIFIDNEGFYHKDLGKLLPVYTENTSSFASLRVNPRMNVNANYSGFLAECFSKPTDEDWMVPDSGFGDGQFQDGDESNNEIENKMLVTLQNHTLLPAKATTISGPRSVKNQKAIKALYKQIEEFIKKETSSPWKSFEEFRTDVNRIGVKSKLDQITAFQSNPRISGFFINHWADFGTNFYGLCDENRKSKGMEGFIKQITQPARILITELEHVVATQSEIHFKLALLNNSRLKEVVIEINFTDNRGKVISSQKITPEEIGVTCFNTLGEFTVVAPKTVGKYELKLVLLDKGKELLTSVEDITVVEAPAVKKAMKKVCFLDESEESSDAIAALSGPEKIIFTANLSAWPDEVLDKIISVTKDGGKTLLLSDMTPEDIEFLNQSHHFDFTIESHWSTGANETSLHYLPRNSRLLPVFDNKSVLDHMTAAITPSLSLNELPDATVYARSVSIKNGELKTGVDLQMVPFGKGKIMFNQFSIFEGLETNVLADNLFTAIIDLL